MKYFFVLFALMMTFSGCNTVPAHNIREEINKANYCENDNDCAPVGGTCPFACADTYVNKNEANRIQEMIDNLEGQCVHDCPNCNDVKCEQNRCIAICE